MNLEQLKKIHQDLTKTNDYSSGTSLENFLKLELGKTTIRILPWKDDNKLFFAQSDIHRYTDADGKQKNYYCRAQSGEDCPLCTLYSDLWKTHREKMGKNSKEKSKYGNLASAIKVNPRYLMNVIDRKAQSESPNEIAQWIKVFSTGKNVFKKIIDTVFNPDYLDETDPDNSTVISLKKGNDFIIEKVMKAEWPNYDGSTFRIKKSPAASEREIKAIMESMHDIHAMIKSSSYEDGKAIVSYLHSTLDTVKGPPPKVEEAEDGENEFVEGLKV